MSYPCGDCGGYDDCECDDGDCERHEDNNPVCPPGLMKAVLEEATQAYHSLPKWLQAIENKARRQSSGIIAAQQEEKMEPEQNKTPQAVSYELPKEWIEALQRAEKQVAFLESELANGKLAINQLESTNMGNCKRIKQLQGAYQTAVAALASNHSMIDNQKADIAYLKETRDALERDRERLRKELMAAETVAVEALKPGMMKAVQVAHVDHENLLELNEELRVEAAGLHEQIAAMVDGMHPKVMVEAAQIERSIDIVTGQNGVLKTQLTHCQQQLRDARDARDTAWRRDNRLSKLLSKARTRNRAYHRVVSGMVRLISYYLPDRKAAQQAIQHNITGADYDRVWGRVFFK